MSNASLIAIETVELELVTGGMYPPGDAPRGAPLPTLNIPGGGSLSCPAGTSPEHVRVTGTAHGKISTEGGLLQISGGGSATYERDRCVPVPKK